MSQDRTLRDVLAQVLSKLTFIDGSFAKADRFLEVLEELKGEPPRHRCLVVGFDNPESSWERVLEQADHFMRLELQMRISNRKFREAEEVAVHDLKMFKQDYQRMETLCLGFQERTLAWKTLHDVKVRANEELLREFQMLQQEKDKMELITPNNVIPMRRKGTTTPPTGTDDWLSPMQVGDVFLAQRWTKNPQTNEFVYSPLLEEFQIALIVPGEYVKLLQTRKSVNGEDYDEEVTVDPVEFTKQLHLKKVIGHVRPE